MGDLQVEAIGRVFVIISWCWLQRDGVEDSYDTKAMTISSLHRTRVKRRVKTQGVLSTVLQISLHSNIPTWDLAGVEELSCFWI